MRRFTTISEFHWYLQLPPPAHPLLSVFRVTDVAPLSTSEARSWSYDFYCIALKRLLTPAELHVQYGQQAYDFEAGVMSFVAPGQVLSVATTSTSRPPEPLQQTGWMLLVHPDFLWHTTLATQIKQYDFWSYAVHEALFLAAKEEAVLEALLQTVQQEHEGTLDHFSKRILVSQLESLLNYADRFYHRQFLTREQANHQVLVRLEQVLTSYFERDDLITRGLPTVQYLAEELHLSPAYLRRLLKLLTGQNTQQHIHHRLIEKAKEKLTSTTLSVSEVAYGLGFEHLPSFSKLFKAKTKLTPLEFKQLFPN